MAAALAAFAGPLSGNAAAQPFSADSLEKRYVHYSAYCSPEKLYLHIDRTYYSSGEKIWFMGYLENASPISKLPTSRYVYVEILSSRGEALTRVKVKRHKLGGFPGYIEIPDSFKSGQYTIRAYTLWQLNRDPRYMFHEEIKVLGRGGKKDIVTSPSEEVDVTFYPEGGRYFAGHRANIAFKAMNANGMSVELEGRVVNSRGENVIETSTFHDGMGQFSFYPEAGEKYFFVCDAGRYRIPAAADKGASVSVFNVPGFIYASICGAGGGQYSLFLRDATAMKHLGTFDLASGAERRVKIGRNALNPGINHLILTGPDGRIVSERLFYIYDSPSDVPLCALQVLQDERKERALIKTRFNIHEYTDFAPVDGMLSVSVVRGSFRNYVQRDDIVSYLKLSSELRGRINAPGYYFDETVPAAERAARMDLLMMVQGWRYYDLPTVFDGSGNGFFQNYAKEYHQRIAGEVNNFYTGGTPRNFIFTVFAPKLHAIRTEEVKGRNRYFLIDSLDFQEGTGFVIKVDKQRRINNYEPKWSGDVLAPNFAYKDKSGRYALATASRTETIPMDVEGLRDTLQAAVVTASAARDPFDSDFTSASKYASDIETYGAFTLIEYINVRASKFIYDNVENVMMNYGAEMIRSEESSQVLPVKLIVDGIEQEWDMFENVHLEDLEKIEVSSSPSAFYNAMGGYVAIKVRSGVNIAKAAKETEPSLQYFVPLGWQVPDYFYSPRYDRGETAEGFDHRHTIYWNPQVPVKSGMAQIEFCNTDQMDYPYIVRIEGRTRDGRPFSCHTTIDSHR